MTVSEIWELGSSFPRITEVRRNDTYRDIQDLNLQGAESRCIQVKASLPNCAIMNAFIFDIFEMLVQIQQTIYV